jgi:DHA1 family tetracycline resistance protein-like MFS transporter
VKSKQAAIGFIFITLLIDVIGFGIIIPVLPDLIAKMKHVSVSEASRYGGILLTVFAIAQFFFSPIMGNLSDQYGRRPVLLFSLLGFSLDYLILAFAPSYGWFLVGRIIAGMTGASFTTASAYIADISDETNRAKNFGMIGAAFGLGFIIGPFLGGLLGDIDPKLPFYCAAGLAFLNFLYGYFILPESLSIENRRTFNWKKANPFSSLKSLFSYQKLAFLVVAYFLLYLGSHAVQSNWTYFTIYKFDWSKTTIGLSLALVGLLVATVQAVLIKSINGKLGNERSIYIGFALYALGMFLFALASQSWMMFVFLIPYCLGGISGPALQSVMTTQVPANEQGALQGGLTSIMSLTSIFGPLLMTGLFTHFTSGSTLKIPGIAFWLGGTLMLTSAIITYYSLHLKKHTA